MKSKRKIPHVEIVPNSGKIVEISKIDIPNT
jgi:hypothetical protein